MWYCPESGTERVVRDLAAGLDIEDQVGGGRRGYLLSSASGGSTVMAAGSAFWVRSRERRLECNRQRRRVP
jgi:hypothetical protein